MATNGSTKNSRKVSKKLTKTDKTFTIYTHINAL